jgi:molybdopterin synthase sulfur carrier subunit
MVNLVYLARLRETFGLASEQIELPPSVRDLRELRALLRSRGGAWAEELADHRPVRAAVNQEMAHGDTLLSDGDEVAFFPPVTGG